MTTEISVVDQAPTHPPMRVVNRQDAIMATSSEALPAALAEFGERRRIFREWLLSNMQEGVHFGVVPGTGGKGGNDPQYRKLPSLYQPGADLIVELMNVRAEFEPDPVAWHQLGAKPGTIAYKCRLFSRDGQVIGEGNGADRIGNKQRDEHAAVMMACKRAKVSAVRTTFSLTDLFSQDLEDLQREPLPNPEQKDDAPEAQPRGERVTKEEFKDLTKRWTAYQMEREAPTDKQEWCIWVNSASGMPIASVPNQAKWTRENFRKCMAELTGGQP